MASPLFAEGVSTSLTSVSCASAISCIAVGVSESPKARHEGVLSVLAGVSCSSISACFAVGYWESPSQFFGSLVERWDGRAWSITPSPSD